MAEEQSFTLKYTGQEINDKLSHISEIDKSIENLQARDTELSNDITTISINVGGYDTSITGLDGRITSNRTDITVLQASVGNHTNDIRDLQDKDTLLENEIANKVDSKTYKPKIEEIETNMGGWDTKYEQFTNAIKIDYSNRITNNETNISSLNARVFGGSDNDQSITKEIENKVAALDQGYRDADNDLRNELSLIITSNTDNISNIEERVTALEGIEQPDLTDYAKSEDLGSINDAITQLWEAVNNLVGRVTKLENNAEQPTGQ